MSDKDALERGIELLQTNEGELPILALVFQRNIWKRSGISIEGALTAFTVYAQIVEGLPCEDPNYKWDSDQIDTKDWFERHAKKEWYIGEDNELRCKNGPRSFL